MKNEPKQYSRRMPSASRGRAQDKSRDTLIIDATLELLGENGYHGLTMTDVAVRAGVSKATLYRRWKAKTDLVADAVLTLDPLVSPNYPNTSLRDDLLVLIKLVGTCDHRPEIVNATMEMARSQPELSQILSERFSKFIRTELKKLATQAITLGTKPLSSIQFEVLGDTIVALLAQNSGFSGTDTSQERFIKFIDHLLLPLLTGKCFE